MHRLAGLAGPRQNQSDVVGLFLIADPVVYGGSYDLTDLRQVKSAVLADQIDQALLAEFAEVIFRFGDPVAVGDENLAGMHFDNSLAIGHLVEEADDRAARLEASDRAVLGDENRRQMASITVGEGS